MKLYAKMKEHKKIIYE